MNMNTVSYIFIIISKRFSRQYEIVYYSILIIVEKSSSYMNIYLNNLLLAVIINNNVVNYFAQLNFVWFKMDSLRNA